MKAKLGVIWPLAALAVLLAVVGVLVQGDTARAAGSFNPTIKVTLSDPTAGANSDITRDFEMVAGDYLYSISMDFTPVAFGLNTNVPIGAYSGDLNAVSTLGLLNNACQTTLPVNFAMMNATLDMSSTVTFEDSYVVGTDGLPQGVTKYPDFLKTLFPGVTPKMRLFGMASAAGTPVTMNTVIFDPGATLFGKAFDASLGRIGVQILNNPAAALAPNPITDQCTPLTAIVTIFGTTKTDSAVTPVQGGAVVSTNPTTPGDYTLTTYDTNRRDADGDGIENYLDTCPYDVNTGVDTDKDGIDDVCDPTPNENTNSGDHDSDNYYNRGDLCPLVANGPAQKDVAGVGNQLDTDMDDIGDACDKNPTTPDGELIERSPTDTVTITGGAAAATPTVAPAETPAPTVIALVTPTVAPKLTPKATPTAAATAAATPKVTPTVVAPKTTPTAISGAAGGGGLLGSDGGFPVWAVCIIAVAAAVMLGSIGMLTTVVWHRRQ